MSKNEPSLIKGMVSISLYRKVTTMRGVDQALRETEHPAHLKKRPDDASALEWDDGKGGKLSLFLNQKRTRQVLDGGSFEVDVGDGTYQRISFTQAGATFYDRSP